MNDGDADLTAAEQEFAARLGQRLRTQAGQIDGATASRLNRARQRALTEFAHAPRSGGWVPALAAATVAGLAVALWLSRAPGPLPPPAVAEIVAAEEPADLDVLMADDSLEMMEDLDFYAWMDPALNDAELQAELESAG